ncbi:GM25103 [Drosophila sechellia]|uniref:GM23157 n=1 Tax=Drosophila sechellia TaxID=7238 RepID=B4II72_DROSE|nr:GM23157 [Drosophila sechellia]EDW51569.1 GM25103 [Drosophila sechellia]
MQISVIKDSSEKPPVKAQQEGHAEGQTEQPDDHKSGSVYTDKALEETIDYVLKSMDLNNDGFVDWAEYRKTEANIGKD